MKGNQTYKKKGTDHPNESDSNKKQQLLTTQAHITPQQRSKHIPAKTQQIAIIRITVVD